MTIITTTTTHFISIYSTPTNTHLFSLFENKKDWKNHKGFCKLVKNKAKKATAVPIPIPIPEASRRNEYTSKPQDKVAKEKVDEWTDYASAGKRMESELRQQYLKYGKSFAEWWDAMTLDEQKALLLDLTCSTIPLTEPSHDEIREKLPESLNQVMSRALFEYNVEALCGDCNCNCDESCKHYFNSMLLHEVADWACAPREKEQTNIRISNQMRDSGTFPDQNEGLTLLVKLFDDYQMKVRRQFSVNPLERLLGCGHCKRSCQVQSAKRCPTCKTSWFCCEGCMVGAGHERCPLGQECESKAIFR
jgi:hypothetical protein